MERERQVFVVGSPSTEDMLKSRLFWFLLFFSWDHLQGTDDDRGMSQRDLKKRMSYVRETFEEEMIESSAKHFHSPFDGPQIAIMFGSLRDVWKPRGQYSSLKKLLLEAKIGESSTFTNRISLFFLSLWLKSYH